MTRPCYLLVGSVGVAVRAASRFGVVRCRVERPPAVEHVNSIGADFRVRGLVIVAEGWWRVSNGRQSYCEE